jgi:hypothetical protein
MASSPPLTPASSRKNGRTNLLDSYFSVMVPPSRGTSETVGLGGGMANSPGWQTLTSEHIWEAGILTFLGTTAYRKQYGREYGSCLFPLSKFFSTRLISACNVLLFISQRRWMQVFCSLLRLLVEDEYFILCMRLSTLNAERHCSSEEAEYG